MNHFKFSSTNLFNSSLDFVNSFLKCKESSLIWNALFFIIYKMIYFLTQKVNYLINEMMSNNETIHSDNNK